MSDQRPALWSDTPQNEADISGRPAFASAVASRIDATPLGNSSTVFGLVGPWGSGKTTLLQDITGQTALRTVWFSPWSAGDVASMTAEFVAALSEAFPTSEDLKTKLLGYARFGVPALKLIPYVGDATSNMAGEALNKFAPTVAWHTEFQRISDAITKEGERVLVVVDDVDRLDAEELRTLLRVIRLLGRFDNVHYLLAYDQTTIDHLLADSGMGGRSSDFMEKIVQYPFEVPPAPAIERRRWAREIVSAVLSDEAQISNDLRIPTEDLTRILATATETPRSAERLREQLSSFVDLATEAELDGLDFVAISWLRISHHDLWDHVRTHPDEFLGWRHTDDDEVQGGRRSRAEALVRRGQPHVAWEAVQFLFGSTSLFDVPPQRKARMRTPRYFQRYFLLGLAEDDVSDARITTAVDRILSGLLGGPEIEALSDIVLAADGERASLALETGRDARRDDSPSVPLVDYIWTLRQDLQRSGRLKDIRQSSLERWLAREIAIVLSHQALDTGDAVDIFGYEFLAACAHGVGRSDQKDDHLVKAAFSPLSELWIRTIEVLPLETVVARPEFAVMFELSRWLGDGVGAGVLAGVIHNAEDLIRIAETFVIYRESHGRTVEYDIGFNISVFRFAVGDAFSKALQAQLPQPDNSLEYQTEDRLSPDLSEAERRDYVIRRLHETI